MNLCHLFETTSHDFKTPRKSRKNSNLKKTAMVPEWFKGNDLRSFVPSTPGFESLPWHMLLVIFL